jgi:hypothetical protein
MADTLQLERNLIHFVHVHEFCSFGSGVAGI